MATMRTIALIGYEPYSHFEGAHVMDDEGQILAVVLEPQDRTDSAGQSMPLSWDSAREERWRHDVRAEARGVEGAVWLVFDPDRGQVEEERLAGAGRDRHVPGAPLGERTQAKRKGDTR